jgi:predicted kinase
MEAVILIGIQGSGKSTFYRDHFCNTHVRISLDVLKTRPRERALVQTCLATGQPFVVDNTNVTAANRAVYIDAARQAGLRVIGYFFDAIVGDAFRRNAQRTGASKIPAAGVAGTLKRLQRPSPAEGFHELYLVTRDPGDQFVINPWTGAEGAADV